MFDIEQAKKELLKKHIDTIQRETAYKWASRAVAAFELFKDNENVAWALDAMEYYHEALEHASLVDPTTLNDVINTVSPLHNEVEKLIKLRLPIKVKNAV